MRPLILSALLALAPTGLAAQTAPAIPASPLRQAATPAAATPLQLGQTWRLEGRTDQGRQFQSELILEQVAADQRAGLEQGFRQTAGAARVSALFAGTPRGKGTAHLLMLSRAGDQDLMVVMPNPSVDDLEAALEDDLTFCFLLPDPGGRSFSGLSLRMREEGETYTVTGTVSDGGTEREQMLNTLRGMYAPLFGVGECRLTRR